MPENYDIQQVCENGHQITACYNLYPKRRKEFCQNCGALTLTACPTCSKEIQGNRTRIHESFLDSRRGGSKIIPVGRANVPNFCSNCGKPYPWTERKIAAAKQLFEEFGDLDDKQKETIEEDINNITKDTPQTELSAMRIKRIWKKSGKIAYNVVMELASKIAAEMLKNP